VTRVWHTAGDLTVRSSAPKPRAAARLIVSRPDSVKPSYAPRLRGHSPVASAARRAVPA
jgi:hypothetical protein